MVGKQVNGQLHGIGSRFTLDLAQKLAAAQGNRTGQPEMGEDHIPAVGDELFAFCIPDGKCHIAQGQSLQVA
ncbi:hypothetical protein D3C75_698760 [compost metagenome]